MSPSNQVETKNGVAEPSLSTAMNAFDIQLGRANDMLGELRKMGDTIAGGKPRDASATATQAPSAAHTVAQFHSRVQALRITLTEMDSEISRINAAL